MTVVFPRISILCGIIECPVEEVKTDFWVPNGSKILDFDSTEQTEQMMPRGSLWLCLKGGIFGFVDFQHVPPNATIGFLFQANKKAKNTPNCFLP